MSRLSQAIAEGDSISVLVEVPNATAAGEVEGQGADGLVLRHGSETAPLVSRLPLLFLGGASEAQAVAADAVVVPVDPESWDAARARGLECVVRVARTEELERALEELDPEVFLLSSDPESDEDALELLLSLLHDVPAGKLAIAELRDATAADVAELERAGVDAVLVTSHDVAAIVPAEPPDV